LPGERAVLGGWAVRAWAAAPAFERRGQAGACSGPAAPGACRASGERGLTDSLGAHPRSCSAASAAASLVSLAALEAPPEENECRVLSVSLIVSPVAGGEEARSMVHLSGRPDRKPGAPRGRGSHVCRPLPSGEATARLATLGGRGSAKLGAGLYSTQVAAPEKEGTQD
jgi:hypothetical protein